MWRIPLNYPPATKKKKKKNKDRLERYMIKTN